MTAEDHAISVTLGGERVWVHVPDHDQVHDQAAKFRLLQFSSICWCWQALDVVDIIIEAVTHPARTSAAEPDPEPAQAVNSAMLARGHDHLRRCEHDCLSCGDASLRWEAAAETLIGAAAHQERASAAVAHPEPGSEERHDGQLHEQQRGTSESTNKALMYYFSTDACSSSL